ncbi:methionine ABC transporter ATP-binding protein [Lentilactobacillus kefiri]|uniref:ABC superfamily ATP binding cassette transporter, binding protein n=4 Tax=Lentilactobacillus kefiri TaxID=33962 RepID=A0A8E1V1H9_LENKE|nr:ATP-binding cassette domain-containing protein [Lentilactobacillus kefiri]KRL57711.1 ABC superfamily ATP binding cassette transporter, binding protein [Lentilactobacillus parakefiri DSM 10551]KRM50611.1 ABC superfamily ATP binding cassette transporter, binding protein [Lentilactobacillus kefiri DSM 20587 = JCM 5818]MCJ2162696.1 ATP-binding cassette domain-containing protein [Lentilactobacillus kefiri]MCP9370087.1 ATP-binding cassette domain-containing protein [Lentilactobacillus kefiri]MDM7
MANFDQTIVNLQDVSVTFESSGKPLHAVDNVSLQINRGDIYGIIGYSGAGKSTLVRTINLLQKPTDGKVIVGGQDLQKLSNPQLRSARKKIGMIFQHFNLLNSRTVLNNVEYPLLSQHISKAKRQAKAKHLLDVVGLREFEHSYPEQLSGGQKQRVAIARSLANDPDILVSDEATSALDPKTTDDILNLLQHLNKTLGLTIVLITHEMQVIKSICHHVAVMDDGKIIERGNVAEVFSNPQQKLTQNFVDSSANVTGALEQIKSDPSLQKLSADERILYLKFRGKATKESLISDLTELYHLKANILFANIERIGDTSIGYLIIIISGKSKQLADGINFLNRHGVRVQLLPGKKEESDKDVNASIS